MACENKIEILENTLLKLIVRNGTNNERVNAVLTNGELGYTTDTKRLWIGDGVTPGGSVAGNLFRGCVADQTAVNSVTDSVEGDFIYNIGSQQLSVWENGQWKVVAAPGGGGTTVTITDNGDGTTSINGNCLLNCDSIIVDNNDGTATVTTPAGDVTLLTGDSICNTTPQAITGNGNISIDNDLGQNSIITLTGDTTLTGITNTSAGDQGLITVVQGTSSWVFTIPDPGVFTVFGGSLVDITGLAQGDVAKIAWETHNNTEFYLWVTITAL